MFPLVSGSWGKDAAKEGNIWAAGEDRVHEDVGEGMSNKRRGWETTQDGMDGEARCCQEGALT